MRTNRFLATLMNAHGKARKEINFTIQRFCSNSSFSAGNLIMKSQYACNYCNNVCRHCATRTATNGVNERDFKSAVNFDDLFNSANEPPGDDNNLSEDILPESHVFTEVQIVDEVEQIGNCLFFPQFTLDLIFLQLFLSLLTGVNSCGF